MAGTPPADLAQEASMIAQGAFKIKVKEANA